jgi:hypothetical protein
MGNLCFTARDPFGLKIVFVEKLAGAASADANAFAPCSLMISKEKLLSINPKDKIAIDPMVDALKDMGLLRRVSQKFVRGWLKQVRLQSKK